MLNPSEGGITLLRPWRYYDEIADSYDRYYETSPQGRLYLRLMETLLEKAIGDREELGIVFEIGGGTGKWTPIFASRASKVIFVEPSERMLKIAMKKNAGLTNVEYVHSRLEDFDCEEKADTVVVLGDVLSYVNDAEEAVEKLSKLCKRGAILIGSVDGYYRGLKDVTMASAFDTLKTFERFRRLQVGNPNLTGESTLSRFYTPSEIERLLDSRGFSCTYIAGIEIFGPYEDRMLSKHMEKIVELELRYAEDREVLGMAEHLFFIASRR